MPKLFSGLGVHRWLIFVAIGVAFVVLANGNVLALLIGVAFLLFFVGPVAAHLVHRISNRSHQ
ncbi:MAG TPA: hypothetical protein VIW19_13790 [Gaiellaceae bacterium]